MDSLYAIAGGSVAGRDHVIAGKNNQDAFTWTEGDTGLVAVVSDGCGSGAHTEVGAALASRLVTRAIQAELEYAPFDPDPDSVRALLEHVREFVRDEERVFVRQIGGEPLRTMNEYLLATVLGAIVTPTGGAIFSIGDGIFALNGEVTRIGPFERNEPPYLAYAVPSARGERPTFELHRTFSADGFDSIFLGTDGAADLTEIADRTLAGRTDVVGSIDEFWTNDRFIRNPDMIRRRLALMNREATEIDWDRREVRRTPGLLADDTTIVVIRRRP